MKPTIDHSSSIPKNYNYINGTVYPNNFPKHLIDYVENDKQLFNAQLTEKRLSNKEDKSKTLFHICKN